MNGKWLIAIATIHTLTAHAADSSSACADLVKLSLPHGQIISAMRIDAGSFKAPDGQNYQVPGVCRVRGLATPTRDSEINFENVVPG